MDGPRKPFITYSADYPKNPENYCKVCVAIPGIRGKFIGRGASNAIILLELADRGFRLTVTLKESAQKKLQDFILEIKKLPNFISTDNNKTYYKVSSKDTIALMLFKAKPGRWDRQLASIGLDIAEDEEEGKKQIEP